jgi:hypothetical protein
MGTSLEIGVRLLAATYRDIEEDPDYVERSLVLNRLLRVMRRAESDKESPQAGSERGLGSL